MKTSDAVVDPRPVLVVGAHPDDESLGCGGTIAKLIHEGREVFIAVLTRGENLFTVLLKIFEHPTPQEVAAIREKETRQAARILGVKDSNVRFLGFTDGKLQSQQDAAVDELATVLREIDPSEVYCTNGFEQHPDHRAADAIVRAACASVGKAIRIRPYFVILPRDLSLADIPLPIEEVDISAFLPVKREALSVFRSHLATLSKQQAKPLAENFDEFLQKQERFIREW